MTYSKKAILDSLQITSNQILHSVSLYIYERDRERERLRDIERDRDRKRERETASPLACGYIFLVKFLVGKDTDKDN
jgi:hypothetical protein